MCSRPELLHAHVPVPHFQMCEVNSSPESTRTPQGRGPPLVTLLGNQRQTQRKPGPSLHPTGLFPALTALPVLLHPVWVPVPIGSGAGRTPPNYSLGQKVPAHELHRTNGLHLLRDVSPKDKHLLFGAALAPQLHQGWPNPVQPLVPALGDERRVKSSVTPKPNPQRTQFHTAWW